MIDHHQLIEVSVGDYILSGGELAAQILLDGDTIIAGVVGRDWTFQESFETGLLEHNHYTQPRVWNGMAAPEILASGHHEKIAAWREDQAKELTKERRPDIWKRFLAKNSGNSGESS